MGGDLARRRVNAWALGIVVERNYRDRVPTSMTRAQVLRFRVRAQQLDSPVDRGSVALAETAVLDLGVQDTGPDGGIWALAIRGVDVSALTGDELATAWTIRGAPHLYRRPEMGSVAAAVAPFSDADAGKRIFDASKPLKAAAIGNLDGLDAVAKAMRSIVAKPMVKGDVSAAVTARMSAPYLRFCRPCDATHLYEMPFRLAALRAGLELQAGTSPPVLQRLPGFKQAKAASQRHDVVRAYLRLLGPATPKHVAEYLDAPVKDVKARWPSDATEVSVTGEQRWMLADEAELEPERATGVRLLGPYDLFLQARDRTLLVADNSRAKALWPAIGRPGAVLRNADLAGLWRPRKSGTKLTVTVELWAKASAAIRRQVTDQAEVLAAFRGIRLAAVDFGD